MLVAQNYGGAAKTVTLAELPHPGNWTEKGGKTLAIAKGTTLSLAPWSTRVFTRRF